MGAGPQGSSEDSWMTLAQAIGGIRAELAEAMAAATNEQFRFDVGDIELEFTVDVRHDRTARAGVRVWVVDLGGGGERSRTSGNRLKVTLHPVDSATGRTPRVADHVDIVPPRRGPR
jgi:Trypsin-co-occurring domain 2